MTKENDTLGTEPIGKLVWQMAIPAVAAQLVNVLYNIVDRMYIGHIPKVGAHALTGVGICFPILILIAAFAAIVGNGGSPLAAIQMGKKDIKGAEKIMNQGVMMLLFFSVSLTALFFLVRKPFLYAFGASSDTIEYALQYLDIYLLGTIFVMMALGLNMYITSQGFAKTAMLSVLIGAGINIILDPILIFGLHMGVRGAAIATIFSQACSALWVIRFLCSDKSYIRIKKEYLKPDWKVIVSIVGLGISPFIMQATESLINVVFNSGLQHYGNDLYVGSMTILQSVMQLIVIPISGLTMGTQPIISYNYGAKNLKRVKKTISIVVGISFLTTTVYCLACVIFPRAFAGLFTTNIDLLHIVEQVLPVFMAGIWIFGIQMSCQAAFMGMGQAKISLFLAVLRKVILLIPLALILPRYMGVMGIYYSEPVADILAAVTTGCLFVRFFWKLFKAKE